MQGLQQLLEALLFYFTDLRISFDLTPPERVVSLVFFEMRVLFIFLLAVIPHFLLAQSCDDAAVEFSFGPGDNGIQFQDQSTTVGTIIWYQWDFGDGNVSFVQNPIHAYDVNGTYEVCLNIIMQIEVEGEMVNCDLTTCHLVEYSEGSGFTCAQYNASFATITLPGNSIIFYSTTEPPGGNHMWQLGDGNSVSGQQITHTYEEPGSYTACLVSYIWSDISQELCVSSHCEAIEVGIPPVSCDDLEAGFTSFYADEALHFTNTSTYAGDPGPVQWSFGDGNSSQEASPGHAYSEVGIYEVCLTVWSYIDSGSQVDTCSSTFCQLVEWTGMEPCDGYLATFNYSIVSGTTVLFEQATDPPAIEFIWEFSDNTTDQGPSVTHEFISPGTYTACLTAWWWNEATQDSCWNSWCELIHLLDPPPCDSAFANHFGWSQSDGHAYFIAAPSDLSLGHIWLFGDGEMAAGFSSDHLYSEAGEYEVCLLSWYVPNASEDTCWTETCEWVVVGPGSTDCNELQVEYDWSSQSDGVQFTNISSAPGLVIQTTWDFGDGGNSNEDSPLHSYLEPGEYEVCLTVWSVIGPASDPDTCMGTWCQWALWEGGIGNPCSGQEASFIGAAGAAFQWIFQSTSQPEPAGSFWDLGDGNTAIGNEVTHTYAEAGSYPVCLTNWWWNETLQDTCWITACDTFLVEGVVECDPSFAVDFTWVQEGPGFTFSATSNLPADALIWNFGDGTNAMGTEVLHLFEPPGPYQVCLDAWYWNVSSQDTCWTSTCHWVEWNNGGECDPDFIVSIDVDEDLGIYFFHAESSIEANGYLWDFGDGTTAFGETTSHGFDPPGPYEVCVNAWYWEETIQDTCWAEACVVVDPFVGVDDHSDPYGLIIYPLPAHEMIHLDASGNSPLPDHVTLLCVDGRSLRSFTIDQWPHALPMHDLAAGIFILRFDFGDHVIQRTVMKH